MREATCIMEIFSDICIFHQCFRFICSVISHSIRIKRSVNQKVVEFSSSRVVIHTKIEYKADMSLKSYLKLYFKYSLDQ